MGFIKNSSPIMGNDPSDLPKQIEVDASGNLIIGTSALPTGASTEAKQDALALLVDGIEGLLTAIKDTDGIKKITDTVNVNINGSLANIPIYDHRDMRGAAADKPLASAVAVGITYWSVDTGVIEVSTGVVWVVV